MFLHPADTSDTIIFGQDKRCNYTATGDKSFNRQLPTLGHIPVSIGPAKLRSYSKLGCCVCIASN